MTQPDKSRTQAKGTNSFSSSAFCVQSKALAQLTSVIQTIHGQQHKRQYTEFSKENPDKNSIKPPDSKRKNDCFKTHFWHTKMSVSELGPYVSEHALTHKNSVYLQCGCLSEESFYGAMRTASWFNTFCKDYSVVARNKIIKGGDDNLFNSQAHDDVKRSGNVWMFPKFHEATQDMMLRFDSAQWPLYMPKTLRPLAKMIKEAHRQKTEPQKSMFSELNTASLAISVNELLEKADKSCSIGKANLGRHLARTFVTDKKRVKKFRTFFLTAAAFFRDPNGAQMDPDIREVLRTCHTTNNDFAGTWKDVGARLFNLNKMMKNFVEFAMDKSGLIQQVQEWVLEPQKNKTDESKQWSLHGRETIICLSIFHAMQCDSSNCGINHLSPENLKRVKDQCQLNVAKHDPHNRKPPLSVKQPIELVDIDDEEALKKFLETKKDQKLQQIKVKQEIFPDQVKQEIFSDKVKQEIPVQDDQNQTHREVKMVDAEMIVGDNQIDQNGRQHAEATKDVSLQPPLQSPIVPKMYLEELPFQHQEVMMQLRQCKPVTPSNPRVQMVQDNAQQVQVILEISYTALAEMGILKSSRDPTKREALLLIIGDYEVTVRNSIQLHYPRYHSRLLAEINTYFTSEQSCDNVDKLLQIGETINWEDNKFEVQTKKLCCLHMDEWVINTVLDRFPDIFRDSFLGHALRQLEETIKETAQVRDLIPLEVVASMNAKLRYSQHRSTESIQVWTHHDGKEDRSKSVKYVKVTRLSTKEVTKEKAQKINVQRMVRVFTELVDEINTDAYASSQNLELWSSVFDQLDQQHMLGKLTKLSHLITKPNKSPYVSFGKMQAALTTIPENFNNELRDGLIGGDTVSSQQALNVAEPSLHELKEANSREYVQALNTMTIPQVVQSAIHLGDNYGSLFGPAWVNQEDQKLCLVVGSDSTGNRSFRRSNASDQATVERFASSVAVIKHQVGHLVEKVAYKHFEGMLFQSEPFLEYSDLTNQFAQIKYCDRSQLLERPNHNFFSVPELIFANKGLHQLASMTRNKLFTGSAYTEPGSLLGSKLTFQRFEKQQLIPLEQPPSQIRVEEVHALVAQNDVEMESSEIKVDPPEVVAKRNERIHQDQLRAERIPALHSATRKMLTNEDLEQLLPQVIDETALQVSEQVISEAITRSSLLSSNAAYTCKNSTRAEKAKEYQNRIFDEDEEERKSKDRRIRGWEEMNHIKSLKNHPEMFVALALEMHARYSPDYCHFGLVDQDLRFKIVKLTKNFESLKGDCSMLTFSPSQPLLDYFQSLSHEQTLGFETICRANFFELNSSKHVETLESKTRVLVETLKKLIQPTDAAMNEFNQKVSQLYFEYSFWLVSCHIIAKYRIYYSSKKPLSYYNSAKKQGRILTTLLAKLVTLNTFTKGNNQSQGAAEQLFAAVEASLDALESAEKLNVFKETHKDAMLNLFDLEGEDFEKEFQNKIKSGSKVDDRQRSGVYFLSCFIAAMVFEASSDYDIHPQAATNLRSNLQQTFADFLQPVKLSDQLEDETSLILKRGRLMFEQSQGTSAECFKSFQRVDEDESHLVYVLKEDADMEEQVLNEDKSGDNQKIDCEITMNVGRVPSMQNLQSLEAAAKQKLDSALAKLCHQKQTEINPAVKYNDAAFKFNTMQLNLSKMTDFTESDEVFDLLSRANEEQKLDGHAFIEALSLIFQAVQQAETTKRVTKAMTKQFHFRAFWTLLQQKEISQLFASYGKAVTKTSDTTLQVLDLTLSQKLEVEANTYYDGQSEQDSDEQIINTKTNRKRTDRPRTK